MTPEITGFPVTAKPLRFVKLHVDKRSPKNDNTKVIDSLLTRRSFHVAHLCCGDAAHHLSSMCAHDLGKCAENAGDFVESTVLGKCR